jgi:hypothetical protein
MELKRITENRFAASGNAHGDVDKAGLARDSIRRRKGEHADRCRRHVENSRFDIIEENFDGSFRESRAFDRDVRRPERESFRRIDPRDRRSGNCVSSEQDEKQRERRDSHAPRFSQPRVLRLLH